jgi:hypothetical protein
MMEITRKFQRSETGMKNSKTVENEKVGESGTDEEVTGLKMGAWEGDHVLFDGIIGPLPSLVSVIKLSHHAPSSDWSP